MSKPSMLWRMTPWGRRALRDIAEDQKRCREVHRAISRERSRYPEIARQTDALMRAERSGFVEELGRGFQRRTR